MTKNYLKRWEFSQKGESIAVFFFREIFRRFLAGDISGAGPLLYVLDGGMKEGGLERIFATLTYTDIHHLIAI